MVDIKPAVLFRSCILCRQHLGTIVDIPHWGWRVEKGLLLVARLVLQPGDFVWSICFRSLTCGVSSNVCRPTVFVSSETYYQSPT